MQTLYVAGPMTGYERFNYPLFRQVGASLAEVGYTVKNPVDVDDLFPTECQRRVALPTKPPKSRLLTRCGHCRECAERTWPWYMRKTIAMLLECDGVAVLPLWRESKGANIEVGIAEALQMPVQRWQAWIVRSYTGGKKDDSKSD